MSTFTVTHNIHGHVATVETIPVPADSIMVFQLPRQDKNLSQDMIDRAKAAVNEISPGTKIIVIGCDIDIHTITGEDATSLKLKGII